VAAVLVAASIVTGKKQKVYLSQSNDVYQCGYLFFVYNDGNKYIFNSPPCTVQK
jgi:hypothetical protein